MAIEIGVEKIFVIITKVSIAEKKPFISERIYLLSPNFLSLESGPSFTVKGLGHIRIMGPL